MGKLQKRSHLLIIVNDVKWSTVVQECFVFSLLAKRSYLHILYLVWCLSGLCKLFISEFCIRVQCSVYREFIWRWRSKKTPQWDHMWAFLEARKTGYSWSFEWGKKNNTRVNLHCIQFHDKYSCTKYYFLM